MSSSEQIFASFFSKAGERITDHTHKLKLNLECLEKSLKELNAKASEVEEQLKGLGQNKRKRGIEEWLTRVKSIEHEVVELGAEVESEGFIRNLMDGGKVAKLNEDVIKLIEQSQRLDGCGTKGVKLLTSTMLGKAFEENCNKILSLLATGEVSSLGVYGMGGVGKTTLAKCINNLLVEQSNVHVFWIGVSQEFTIKNLQDKIAYFLGINLLSENDEDIRAVTLHEALSSMKGSVLILDDVWKNIDMRKLGCPVSKECCRLIITSRSLEVCRKFRCQEVIGVKTLDKDEAWKLLIETLAWGNEIEVLSPPAAKIAKSVLERCDGLPLGIITVAENMRGKKSVQTWTNALAELEEPVARHCGIGVDEVFRVLKYSFDELNDQSEDFNLLQLCFLYCSLYLPGSLLRKQELVGRFISEGLMDGRKSRTAQLHQGCSILDKLVDLCLLETVNNYGCLKMHDLLRGMALKIKEGKYMVRSDYSQREIPKEEEWAEDLEKVSLMENDIRFIRGEISPNCPKISTLLLCDNPLEFIANSFFSKMQGLCTLDLCSTEITMLPDSISEMKCLKALLLESCSRLKRVPYLGKLTALRELNLSHTAIEEVPEGVEELLNLRLLSTVGTRLKSIPKGLLLNFEHLQYLTFPVHVLVRLDEIVILKEVEKFEGRLSSMHAFNRFLKTRFHDALHYHVQVGKGCDGGGNDIFAGDDRAVYLSECNLEDGKILGSGIQSLKIRECEGLSNCIVHYFSPFSYPSSLKMLIIERCGGIECVLTNSRESLALVSSLQLIHLEALKDFERLVQKREIGAAPARAVFSSLTMLRIINCNRTRKLGLPVSGVPNLTHLDITNCGGIEEIFEDEGRGSITLPNLKTLSLYGLPRLKFVCKATIICNMLMFISIFRCPELTKKLPMQSEPGATPPPVKRVIRVEREWWESLEWENPSLPLLLQPFVQFLI